MFKLKKATINQIDKDIEKEKRDINWYEVCIKDSKDRISILERAKNKT